MRNSNSKTQHQSISNQNTFKTVSNDKDDKFPSEQKQEFYIKVVG